MAKQDELKSSGENSKENNPAIDDTTKQLQKMAKEAEGEKLPNPGVRMRELIAISKNIIADRNFDNKNPRVYSDEDIKKIYDEADSFLSEHKENEFDGQDKANFEELRDDVFPDLDIIRDVTTGY